MDACQHFKEFKWFLSLGRSGEFIVQRFIFFKKQDFFHDVFIKF